MKFKVPLYEPSIGIDEKRNVNECLNTNWISSRGKFVEEFENKFKKYVGVKYAVSVCNGTAALHLALLALNIGKNDEVLVPSFTYVASVNSIKYVNAKVKFLDIKLSNWQVDENLIHQNIKKNTKALIVPHIYGQIANIEKIKKICKRNKIYLVEDCAEAFGTYYKKKHAGSFGDVSTFSFFGSKTITTGEGGMVLTNNKSLASKIDRLKMVGVVKNKYYWHNMIGYNYRMTNICAAIGCAQMKKSNILLKKKRKIFEHYKKYSKNLPISYHEEVKGTTHSYWLVSILLHKKGIRNKLIKYLKKYRIETRPCFYPVHTMPMYRKNTKLRYPISEYISRNGINLPSGSDLKISQIRYVIKHIKKFLKKNKNHFKNVT